MSNLTFNAQMFLNLGALALTCLGLLAGCVLLAALRAELLKKTGRVETAGQLARQELSALQARFNELSAELQETREHAHLAVATSPAPPRMNINKRGQVLRLHRRGENPAQISSSLGLARGEVDLILKVQSMIFVNYQ